MHSGTSNKPLIKFSKNVNSYFNELIEILIWQGYFGFEGSALKYVSDMKNYIETYISVLPTQNAPRYFDKYKKGMKYITYQANRQTTWYIFFKQKENRFMIYYISNNHFEGQYIR